MNKKQPKEKPYVVAIYSPYAEDVKRKLRQLKERDGVTISRIVVKAILSL